MSYPHIYNLPSTSELLKSEQFICKPSLNLILIEFTPDIPQAV